MKLLAPIIKLIFAYDLTEWEIFIREWATSIKPKYLEIKRIGGPGDMGRDVVGFVDVQKFEGIGTITNASTLVRCCSPPKQL